MWLVHPQNSLMRATPRILWGSDLVLSISVQPVVTTRRREALLEYYLHDLIQGEDFCLHC